MQQVVLGADRDRVEQVADAAIGDQHAPDRDDREQQADRQRHRPRPARGGDQAGEPGDQVGDVVPAVGREDAEDVVGDEPRAGAEVGLVEEAGDPADDERRADQQDEEAGGARWLGCVVHPGISSRSVIRSLP